MSNEPIKELQGATLIRAVAVGDDEIVMVTSDGLEVTFYHAQDCCESVTIEDVNGDWQDLIGTPLLVAEVRTDQPDTLNSNYDSVTYTFYTFRTIKGSVDVRWCGASNGYYSEAVNTKTRKLDFKGVVAAVLP